MIDASSKPSADRLRWFYLAGLFFTMLGAKLALIGSYGNSTPFWDQWDGEARAILAPAFEGNLQAASLFNAHNEHRIFLTRVLSLGLFKANALWDPKVEMVAQAFIHVAALVALIAVCGRFLEGYQAKLLFGGFAAVLFMLPFGWENTLWGFQSQFYFVVLWGVIGIACCWRHSTLSPGWWLGVLVLSLGLISMAGGVFAPAATCGLAAVRLWENKSQRFRQGTGLLVLAALTVAGLLLTKHASYHDALKAKSTTQFVQMLIKIGSWPTKTGMLAILFQAPPFLLLGWALMRRVKTKDSAWLVITLGMWCAAQAIAIAYGRAGGGLAPRYADNFALGLCVNAACMLYLAKTIKERFPKPAFFLCAGWFGTVTCILLIVAGFRLPFQINERLEESRRQETNVRGFLATGDLSHLRNKPRMDIPFPDGERLARTLGEPAIRAILPTNLRDPLPPVVVKPGGDHSFERDVYPPDFSRRPFESAWSSYASSPAAETGHALELRFPAERRTTWLKISVAGYNTAKDLSLQLTGADGKTRTLDLPSAATRWKSVFFRPPTGPFTLQARDDSFDSWFAFTLPVEVGPLSLAAGFLQDMSVVILLLGALLAGIAVWRDPHAAAFARHHRLF